MKKNSIVLVALPLLFFACSKEQNQVIAKAGQIRITNKDLLSEIDNSPDAYKTYLSTLEGKKQFLDIILRERILLNAAERSGVIRTREVQQSLKAYRERMKEQETEYRKGVLLREYLRQLKDHDLKVDEAELKKYYEDVCILDQKFVKNTDITVGTMIKEMIAKTGENITIKRFIRYQL